MLASVGQAFGYVISAGKVILLAAALLLLALSLDAGWTANDSVIVTAGSNRPAREYQRSDFGHGNQGWFLSCRAKRPLRGYRHHGTGSLSAHWLTKFSGTGAHGRCA